jgi:hypothetical protein
MAKGRSLPVLLAFVAALACAREAVPQELIGRWGSDDPRYADRPLDISTEHVVFGVGPGGRIKYLVRGVEREPDSATGTLYRLYYYDFPGEPERTLELRLPQPGQLQIGSRSELWTREGAPSSGG